MSRRPECEAHQRSEVSTRSPDSGTPWLEGGENRLDVVAEHGQGVSHRSVGGGLDRFAQLETSLGDAVAIAVEQAGSTQPPLPRIEMFFCPSPSAGVRSWGEPPVQVAEQPNLYRIEPRRRPGGNMRVAAKLAQPIGRAPQPCDRVIGDLCGELTGEQGPTSQRKVVGSVQQAIGNPTGPLRLTAQNAPKQCRAANHPRTWSKAERFIVGVVFRRKLGLTRHRLNRRSNPPGQRNHIRHQTRWSGPCRHSTTAG